MAQGFAARQVAGGYSVLMGINPLAVERWLADVMAGRVPLTSPAVLDTMPCLNEGWLRLNEGWLRPLAVTSPARFPVLLGILS